MAINVDLNTKLVNQAYAIYSKAEIVMLERVKKRVKRGIIEIGTPELKLREVQALKKEIEIIAQQSAKLVSKTMNESVVSAYKAGVRSAERDFDLPNSLLTTTQVPAKIQALILEFETTLARASFRILRDIEDVFSAAQADSVAGSIAGVETRKQATRRMLNVLADRGIRSFVDKSGRSWELGSYAEMATRSATANAALQGQVDRQLENNRDLIVISDHDGECPRCRPWEGKVLSLSGQTQSYPTLDEAKAGGLFHPNCKHTLTGYIPGLTVLDADQRSKSDAESDEMYQYQQRQRYNERQIRKWKRREALSITDGDSQKAKDNIRLIQKKQRDLIKDYENKFDQKIRRKYDRESINNRSGVAGVNGPSWLTS